jgi:hypothetical protein
MEMRKGAQGITFPYDIVMIKKLKKKASLD